MESKVPEELLREILKNTLSISSIHAFLLDLRQKGYALWRIGDYDGPLIMPRSDPLLVSKRWLRIGTPLFYQTIVIRDNRQAKQLAEVLCANPGLGSLIRNVRLEGGYAKDLLTVVKQAPRIHSLAVSLIMLSKDSNAGLLRALSHLNPSCLYLHAPWGRRGRNQKSLAIRKALYEAMGGWTSLETVCLATVYWADDVKPALDAIANVPALRSVSLAQLDLERCLMKHKIFESAQLDTIICRGTDTRFAKFMEEMKISPDIRRRVIYEETKCHLPTRVLSDTTESLLQEDN